MTHVTSRTARCAARRQVGVDSDAVAHSKFSLVTIGHVHRQVFRLHRPAAAHAQMLVEDGGVIDGGDFQFGLKDPGGIAAFRAARFGLLGRW